MHHTDILFAILAAFSLSTANLIEKYYLLNKFNPTQIMFLRPIFFFTLSVISIKLYYSNFNFLKKITYKDAFIVFLSVLFSFIGFVSILHLLKKNKASVTVSITKPLYILSLVLLSYLFYNEKINKKQSIGLIFVVVGIFLINYFKEQ